MLHTLWNVVFYNPLYNALVALVRVVPFHDVGIALVVLTVIVKLILAPLTKKSLKSQLELKHLEPELARIKRDYPDKAEQSKKTFELYREKKINPFSGCLVVLIQLPIIFALYFVFLKGLAFDAQGPLYSFIHLPPINMNFLGLVDISRPNIVMALLAGVTQFFQLYLAQPFQPKPAVDASKPTTFRDDIMKNMNSQMKYTLPILVTFIAWKISAAVALYWATSNLVTIIQQYLINKKMNPKATVKVIA